MQRNYKKTVTSSSRQPFCKVCFDAGKTEQTYTSHYVKSREGIVTCPTLKNLTCKYCRKNGHMISHCEEAKKNAAARAQQQQRQVQPLKPQKPQAPSFPPLPSSKTQTTQTKNTSGFEWNTKALFEKQEKREQEEREQIQEKQEIWAKIQRLPPIPMINTCEKRMVYNDDDDDDDDEYGYNDYDEEDRYDDDYDDEGQNEEYGEYICK